MHVLFWNDVVSSSHDRNVLWWRVPGERFFLIRYFPLDRGLYEVAPGLFPLGYDFGNGENDKKIFQIENDFQHFRDNKIEGKKERLSKYLISRSLPDDVRSVAINWFLVRLATEWPQYFQLNSVGEQTKLMCSLTNESFVFDQLGNLEASNTSLHPEPNDALEALGFLIPEDFAILSRENQKDQISYLHLFSPSHWAAEDKIGLNFHDIHSSIPGSDRLVKASTNLVEAMIHKGPFVRFVWSFVTDERLNHHPVAPPGVDPVAWRGRSFDASRKNPFSLRIERQVTYGLPEVEAALFFIKISFWSGLEIKADSQKRNLLISALQSMTPESRVYKGVKDSCDDLISWLNPERFKS